MNQNDIAVLKVAAQDALAECGGASDFAAAAEHLLNTLGYKSERRHPTSGETAAFVREFKVISNQQHTASEQRFVDAAKSTHIIFQYTAEEIKTDVLFGGGGVDRKEGKSFLFVAVELKNGGYSRGKYAEFTREINKRFAMPIVVLFRAPDAKDAGLHRITLAFVGRRIHKLNPARDVLEKVSLLREIKCADTHRAHLDILAELSLDMRLHWISREKKTCDFDGLLAAWLDELNADALNKRFYGDLLGWFDRARKEIECPGSAQNKHAGWIIRLITRMLFIWFIKEKGLVAEKLFAEEQIKLLLKNYDRLTGGSYYCAVLQNLFFATLNTEIGNRGFRPDTRAPNGNEHSPEYRVFTFRRYKDLMTQPAMLEKLLDKTPFVNGGLFDCLDTDDGNMRVDYFTDNKKDRNQLHVPNHLFFGDSDSSGLLDVLRRYKFTVEENTPIEQEVALDPELLGQVFENLLAAENPETRESTRKQTGSFYTPRTIVDYMTGESLIAYFCGAISGGDSKALTARLRGLLSAKTDYENTLPKNKLSEDEIQKFIAATGNLRILDSAVGSGAFPMGALAQLTMALQRIDPENAHLKNREMKKAEAFETAETREQATAMVEEIFSSKNQFNNYGRKLSLIQNSIFGVDIQPIAVQICRLRFFISLAIEQETNADSEDNYGVRPLPNLEAKIIAADSLIAIASPDLFRDNKEVKDLEAELRSVRRDFFAAATRDTKRKCITKDKEKREELAALLRNLKYPTDDADRIAQWNLYDQNATADWFDAEWMFGIVDGFDIVVGNPPYVQLQRDGGRLRRKYESQKYGAFASTGDVYMLFYERGLNLCRKNGVLIFITSNSWLRANYGANLRGVLVRYNPRLLVNMGKDIFDSVYVDANILLIENRENQRELQAADINRTGEFPPSEWNCIAPQNKEGWVIISASENKLCAKIEKAGVRIKNWDVNIFRGLTVGYEQAFVIDTATKNRLCAANSIGADIVKPTIRGKNISRYSYESAGEWVIVIPQGWTDSHRGKTPPEQFFRATYPAIYDHFKLATKQQGKGRGLYARYDMGDYWWELRPCAFYLEFEKEKLMWIQLVNDGRFTYDTQKLYPMASVFVMIGEDIKYLLALLNSRLVNWQMRHLSPTSGMGVLQWKKVYVEKLPVPQISKTEQSPFIRLAEKIAAAKAADPAADTSQLEKEIDARVYALYGLTAEEIKIVEAGG